MINVLRSSCKTLGVKDLSAMFSKQLNFQGLEKNNIRWKSNMLRQDAASRLKSLQNFCIRDLGLKENMTQKRNFMNAKIPHLEVFLVR